MSPITLHYYITAASSTDLKSSAIKYWDLLVLFDYTGCFRRNFPHLKKMFLRSHYINITKKTQSEVEVIQRKELDKFLRMRYITHLLITKYMLK